MTAKSTGKVRLYEIAKELDIKAGELTEKCKAAGYAVKSHSSTVSDEEADEIRRRFGPAKGAPAPAAAAAPAPAPAVPASPPAAVQPPAKPAAPPRPDTSAVKPSPPPAPPRMHVRPAPGPVPKKLEQRPEHPGIRLERPVLPKGVAAAADAVEETLAPAGSRERIKPRKPMAKTGKPETHRRTFVFKTTPTIKPKVTEVELEPPVTVKSLSAAIGVRVNELIRSLLLRYNIRATVNTPLDGETIQLIAMEHGVTVTLKKPRTVEDRLREALVQEERPEDLVPRPPVVTFLGHVDHGKTSLLDRIIRADIVSTEAGGITQDIRAHQVTINGHKITFIDTPGHEAFTAMRARGATVTDIVVLVVAADDGVMPQTEEAISHARAADVPVVVAINKIDKPEANVMRTKQQLSTHGLNPEDWGGETGCVEVSALTGEGVDDLLERILLEAEILEIKGNPAVPARGAVLEARMQPGLGTVAMVLVQNGTLRVGDVILCGAAYGRVKSIQSTKGAPLDCLEPAQPGIISGLNSVPSSGEKLYVLPDLEKARELAAEYEREQTAAARAPRQHVTLENLLQRLAAKKVKEFNVIVKADMLGTLEPIVTSLARLEHPEVRTNVIHQGIGGINESDVVLAEASDAVILAFRVTPDERARELADQTGVEIRRYSVIYEIIDEVRAALEGLLKPKLKEVRLGLAEVRRTFKISRLGTIAGCYVRDGRIVRNAGVRLIRDNVVIFEGRLQSLRREKDDVSEVQQGFECGIKIADYNDLKEGDAIECFKTEEVKQKLTYD